MFVQPFRATGAKWQVSIGGGRQPAWRRDGRELYFVTNDGRFYVVDVRRGAAVASTPQPSRSHAGSPLPARDVSAAARVTAKPSRIPPFPRFVRYQVKPAGRALRDRKRACGSVVDWPPPRSLTWSMTGWI